MIILVELVVLLLADFGDMASSSSHLKSTIWIGNIDPKATEAQVLKLVKPHGKVVKFDFVYGLKDATSNERIPRGYAFVTYDNYVSANQAIRSIQGLQLLSKPLKAQWSSSSSGSSSSGSKVPLSLSLSSKTAQSKLSKESKIKAMEAKLKSLEKSKDEFKVVVPAAKKNTKPYDRPKSNK